MLLANLLSIGVVGALAVSDEETSVCTKELAGIVAEVDTGPQIYLHNVSKKFKAFKRLLFTPQASSIVANFEQEFGVNVQLQSPFILCSGSFTAFCNSSSPYFDNGTPISPQIYNLTIPIYDPGRLTSIYLSAYSGIVGGEKAAFDFPPIPKATLFPPNGQSVEIYGETCLVRSEFDFTLSDASTEPFDCTTADSGILYQPTNSFAPFLGTEALGDWILQLNIEAMTYLQSIALSYCTEQPRIGSGSSCTYSRDIARSNINVPGYRYDSDSGIAYYTTVIRNIDGQELYATISRSIIGMFMK